MPRTTQATPGARLRSARQDAGLTQAQIADRIGTAQPNVARDEAETDVLSLDRLWQYAVAIGCDPGDLDPRLRHPGNPGLDRGRATG